MAINLTMHCVLAFHKEIPKVHFDKTQVCKRRPNWLAFCKIYEIHLRRRAREAKAFCCW